MSDHKPNEVLIAIWPTAHDPLDRLIRFFTRGKGTHAAFVRGNGKIVENFWPHVRERLWKQHEGHKAELYRLDGLTAADSSRLERWFDYELRNPPSYSIRDLFRFLFNLPPVNNRSCFCSQWVLRGLRLCLNEKKQPLVRLEYTDFAAPRDLRMSPRLIRVHVEGIT